jgi:hypothetical protein
MKMFSKIIPVFGKTQTISLVQRNVSICMTSPPSPRPSPQGEGETLTASLENFAAGFARWFPEQLISAHCCSLSRRERARVRGNAAKCTQQPHFFSRAFKQGEASSNQR